jgi:hypothetical protein
MTADNPVKLRQISEEEKARWNALVEASPHGSIFHTWPWVNALARHGWMKVLGERLKSTFHPLIAEYEGKDIGIIPLYEYRGRILKYVVSPPKYTDVSYLGPILNFPENLKRSSWEHLHRNFHDAVDDYIKNLGGDCVWIRTPPGYDDMRPYLWQGYNVTPLYNYSLDLRQPTERLFENTREDFRKRVRKAEREGYVVSEGSFSDVEKLFSQQNKRYDEKGMHMNISLDYLKELFDGSEPGSIRVFKAELKGEFVSASVRTFYKKKVTGWFGSPKNTSTGGNPNDLLHWSVIKLAASQGYEEYENVWANEESLNDYKTKINPRLNVFYSVTRMKPHLSSIVALKKYVKGGNAWGAGLG